MTSANSENARLLDMLNRANAAEAQAYTENYYIRVENTQLRSTIQQMRTALDAAANILDKNAAMLDQLVMDTPKDQELNDRVVATTRECADGIRTVLEGGQ